MTETAVLYSALREWRRIAAQAAHAEGVEWREEFTTADVDHSSLLRRILEGGPVYEHAPPRAFSYPWIDLLEKRTVEGNDVFVHPGELNLNQSRWRIVGEPSPGVYEAEWAAGHPWRVRVEPMESKLPDWLSWRVTLLTEPAMMHLGPHLGPR